MANKNTRIPEKMAVFVTIELNFSELNSTIMTEQITVDGTAGYQDKVIGFSF